MVGGDGELSVVGAGAQAGPALAAWDAGGDAVGVEGGVGGVEPAFGGDFLGEEVVALEGQVGARFELRPGPDEDGTVVVFMALTAPFF